MKLETWNLLRDWLVRVGILLFTLFLCLGLFEIGCRIMGVDFSLNPVWKFHPILAWCPGKSPRRGWWSGDHPFASPLFLECVTIDGL